MTQFPVFVLPVSLPLSHAFSHHLHLHFPPSPLSLPHSPPSPPRSPPPLPLLSWQMLLVCTAAVGWGGYQYKQALSLELRLSELQRKHTRLASKLSDDVPASVSRIFPSSSSSSSSSRCEVEGEDGAVEGTCSPFPTERSEGDSAGWREGSGSEEESDRERRSSKEKAKEKSKEKKEEEEEEEEVKEDQELFWRRVALLASILCLVLPIFIIRNIDEVAQLFGRRPKATDGHTTAAASSSSSSSTSAAAAAAAAAGAAPSAAPGADEEVSMSKRLAYKVDVLFSMHSWVKGAALLAATLLLIALGGLALYAVGSKDRMDLGDATWRAWSYVADAGNHADSEGVGPRIVGVSISIGGMLIFALMVGLVSEGISEKVDSLKKGKSDVIEKNHTLILGWSDKLASLLKQLAVANESMGGGVVVVMSEREKEEMESEIQKMEFNFRGTTSLSRLLRALIVLAEAENADAADARALRVVLSLMGVREGLRLTQFFLLIVGFRLPFSFPSPHALPLPMLLQLRLAPGVADLKKVSVSTARALIVLAEAENADAADARALRVKVSVSTARALIVLAEAENADAADARALRVVLSLTGVREGLRGHIVVELSDIDNQQLVKGLREHIVVELSDIDNQQLVKVRSSVERAPASPAWQCSVRKPTPSNPVPLLLTAQMVGGRMVETVVAHDMVGGRMVETVVAHDVIGRLMIQCARQPGLAQIWETLLGFENCEFYTKHWPELVGKTFREVLLSFPDAVPCGLRVSARTYYEKSTEAVGFEFAGRSSVGSEDEEEEGEEGEGGGEGEGKRVHKEHTRLWLNPDDDYVLQEHTRLWLNPDDDYVLQPEDSVLVIAEDDDSYAPGPLPVVQDAPLPDIETPPKLPEKILFCGWRRDIDDMITVRKETGGGGRDEGKQEGGREWGEKSGETKELWIFSDVPVEEREARLIEGGLNPSELENVMLVHRMGNAVIRRHLEFFPSKPSTRELENVTLISCTAWATLSSAGTSTDEWLEDSIINFDSRYSLSCPYCPSPAFKFQTSLSPPPLQILIILILADEGLEDSIINYPHSSRRGPGGLNHQQRLALPTIVILVDEGLEDSIINCDSRSPLFPMLTHFSPTPIPSPSPQILILADEGLEDSIINSDSLSLTLLCSIPPCPTSDPPSTLVSSPPQILILADEGLEDSIINCDSRSPLFPTLTHFSPTLLPSSPSDPHSSGRGAGGLDYQLRLALPRHAAAHQRHPGGCYLGEVVCGGGAICELGRMDRVHASFFENPRHAAAHKRHPGGSYVGEVLPGRCDVHASFSELPRHAAAHQRHPGGCWCYLGEGGTMGGKGGGYRWVSSFVRSLATPLLIRDIQSKRMPAGSKGHRRSNSSITYPRPTSTSSWVGQMQQASQQSIVISEILDSRTALPVSVSKISDYVLSNELVSMALAMVAEDREVNRVLEELFSEEGNEMYIRPAELYLTDGEELSFFEVAVRARQRMEIIIGYRLFTEDEAVLNPPDKAERRTWSIQDTFIVLSFNE
ncbi:unnamed protein product [Closterium sp. NIES-64]|nr:unnamed protein product [Closterium sp. NIES-64]